MRDPESYNSWEEFARELQEEIRTLKNKREAVFPVVALAVPLAAPGAEPPATRDGLLIWVTDTIPYLAVSSGGVWVAV